MEKIYFISSAPIEYAFKNLSIYESFDLVSRGIKTATLKSNSSEFLKNHIFKFPIKNIKTILTAPKGQTFKTGKLLKRLKIIPNGKLLSTKNLNGINFSMTELLGIKEFNDLGYKKAIKKSRRKFIEELYDGKLTEKLPELKKRIIKLLDIILKNDGSTLCIGHSFFLKIVEIHLKNPKSFKNRTAFIKAFEPNKKPYNSLEGFSANKTDVLSQILD